MGLSHGGAWSLCHAASSLQARGRSGSWVLESTSCFNRVVDSSLIPAVVILSTHLLANAGPLALLIVLLLPS